MPLFHYTALTPTGTRISGEQEALSEAELLAALQSAGRYPLSTSLARPTLASRLIAAFRRRPSGTAALAVATHELAALLAAGLPLDRALDLVATIAGDRRLAAAFAAIRERVRGGSGLAAALEAAPRVFPPLYVSMVHAGESAGGLEVALARLAEYLERARAVREQVRSALVYPIILLVTAGLSLTFVLTTVLPQFKPLFAQAGQALPVPTQIVMAAADLVTNWGWLVVLVGLGCFLALRRALEDPAFRRRWDARVLRLPLLGTVVTEAEAARFARTLGTLLKSGMTLPQALGLARESLGNAAMAAAVGEATISLRAGESLGLLLERSRLFPDLAGQLVRVGEATGKLDEMLLHQAGLFERNVQRATERALSALVPGLTIALGLLVAAIVGSVLLAILKINDLAG